MQSGRKRGSKLGLTIGLLLVGPVVCSQGCTRSDEEAATTESVAEQIRRVEQIDPSARETARKFAAMVKANGPQAHALLEGLWIAEVTTSIESGETVTHSISLTFDEDQAFSVERATPLGGGLPEAALLWARAIGGAKRGACRLRENNGTLDFIPEAGTPGGEGTEGEKLNYAVLVVGPDRIELVRWMRDRVQLRETGVSDERVVLTRYRPEGTP